MPVSPFAKVGKAYAVVGKEPTKRRTEIKGRLAGARVERVLFKLLGRS